MTVMTHPVAGEHPALITHSRRPVDPGQVCAQLVSPLRWRVEQVTVTGSTNADLAGAAPSLESGQVRTAEEQLTGRGRSGRDWFCPPGAGLMFSALLRLPQVPADRRGWTGALLGLAVVHAIDDAVGDDKQLRISLKWPNDVLIDGRKCAGILGELVADAVVVGAGINISLCADELPRADATSLLLAGGTPAGGSVDAPQLPAWLDRSRLLAGILDGFGDLLDRWVAAEGDVDVSGIRAEYLGICSTVGATVRLILPGGAERVVRAMDVGADGGLITEDDAGRRTAYSAADVVHLRPGG